MRDVRTQIPEFKFIADWALSKNLRVYLGGGTAAGLAVQVKNNLEDQWLKSHGLKPRIPTPRLAYQYFLLYRSNQDADLILDGTEGEAQELETLLKEKFAYLQGGKSLWEVRLLRENRGTGIGEKEAILNNPDFLNQNSDSFSTAALELTESDEPPVRDLYDWNNVRDPQFLKDLLDGELHLII